MGDEKIIVKIDPDLEELIPEYIESRQEDIQSIAGSLDKGDFEKIRIIGHSMKGSGGGYGFDRISEIGSAMEIAAEEKNESEIRKAADELSLYLNNVEVVYE